MPLKTHMDEQPELNLTPMIDIVFLLIIFFMVGTKVSEMERKIALDVPRISNTEALSPAPRKRIVNILQDGRILLDEEEVTVDELVRRLQLQRQQDRQMGVIVRGDANGSFQNVASVLGACRQAGISDMGISVRTVRKLR
ncbi:MAG: biopolymer transporter ExbD [Planctomycetaceae bacterium]|nr:biopolymer transporter ExbD [Planctomycetaceae bacterium]MCP4811489.1 biopolymer transporter ExbD [Planctomycetaceae bacterium]